MFVSKLYNIKNRLNKFVDKDTMLKEAIQEKLDNSLSMMSEEIAKSYSYLTSRNSLNVMRKMTKKTKEYEEAK